jgi:hypothetical protein
MDRKFRLTHELTRYREELDARFLGIVGAKGTDVVIENTGVSRII